MLSSSGHIQSILNPPGNPKSRYMTSTEVAASADEWQENSTKHTDFLVAALAGLAGPTLGRAEKVPTKLGNKAYPAGEAAPGTYVHER